MVRKMKDSGVEWIGDVPERWAVKEIRKIFKERNEKVSDYDYQPLSVTKNGIVLQLENAAKSDNHDNRKKVKKNDFVINSRSDRKMSSGLSDFDGSVSVISIVLHSENIEPEFTKYLLKNYGFAEEFYRWGTGIVADLWSTRYERMKKISIPLPDSKTEQKKIANFLDEKTSHIDSIIEKTKQSIEEFKRYKQALITETVTKGLNPNVNMKDSGIEWIGEIPEHWEMTKMKRLGTVRNGLTYSPVDLVEEENGTLVLRSGNIQNAKLSFKDTAYVSRTISDSLYVKNGDILICARNGSRSLIGKNAIIDTDIEASFGAFMMLFRTTELSKYIYYILNSEVFNFYLGTFLTATINQLTKKNFDNMNVVFCTNPKEQQQIVEYLDEMTTHLDSLIENKINVIAQLEEYKKSMIYEYVTGKKEVE